MTHTDLNCFAQYNVSSIVSTGNEYWYPLVRSKLINNSRVENEVERKHLRL